MESFNEQIENIKAKLGEENSALVSDELLSLLTEHKAMTNDLNERNEEITKLNAEKENLVSANSKLFQRIGFENNLGNTFSTTQDQAPKEVEKIKLGDIINENGELL